VVRTGRHESDARARPVLTYMDHTIDHIGPITKTVVDNALMLEVIAGADWRDRQWVRSEPEAGH
jgi:amidase